MESTKTGMRCSVKFCQSKASFRNKSFFSYPKEPNRLKVWITNCDTNHLAEALLKSNNYRVCADHFEETMFLNSTTKNRLVHDAVPRLFSGKKYYTLNLIYFCYKYQLYNKYILFN